jgi:hypothetical protein
VFGRSRFALLFVLRIERVANTRSGYKCGYHREGSASLSDRKHGALAFPFIFSVPTSVQHGAESFLRAADSTN